MDPELTDREYYADPYGPLDCDEDDEVFLSGNETEEYQLCIYHECADEAHPYDDDWDEGDLTEAQHQDRSWDEYDDGVFYNSEDLEDD